MWGLVVFLFGLAYGYFSPGKQDKGELFKKGLLIGLAIAIVVAILGFLFNANPLGLGDRGFLGILLSALILTILFVIGAWLGDLIEGRRGGTSRSAGRV